MATSKYEVMLIFSAKLSEDELNALTEKFKALIEEHGKVLNQDIWGKRKLAYPIDRETDGYYVLFDFESGPDFPGELDRVAKITDGVLRSLIVKND